MSVIGFEQPSYTLREGDGMQHVCVVVVSPQLGAPFQLEVALNVHTINDTAGRPSINGPSVIDKYVTAKLYSQMKRISVQSKVLCWC